MSASPSLARPPPPPRRRVPVPPAQSNGAADNNDTDLETRHAQELAARVATINLNTAVGRASIHVRGPPPVPSRGRGEVRRTLSSDQESNRSLSTSPAPPDLSKLLARRPPPPPSRRISAVDASDVPPQSSLVPDKLPPRRLPPPLPANVHAAPTPPPLNLATKPVAAPAKTIALYDLPPFDGPSCLQCRDFSRADAHAALFPRHSVHSLEHLAYSLAEPFDEDADKARVLFTWLHYNIAYDAVSFLSGNVQHATPESTLSSGLAVCEGYAGLFERLADIIGLQAHKVSGHGKGYGYQDLPEGDPAPEMTSNHAWNCVLIDQEWHLIDPCWGAGVLNGTVYEAKFAPQWFISSPVEFGRKHFPQDPAFQLTPEQTTWEEYILAPEGPTITSDFQEFNLHPLLVEPSTKLIPEKRFTKFSVSKRCEHMSTTESDNYVFVISTSDKDFTAVPFNEEEGAWTTTVFTPRDGNVTLYAVHTVNNKDAKGLGVAGFTQAKGRKAMSFKGLASWTITHL